jgi:co-chaperonin GroES (HSP10)
MIKPLCHNLLIQELPRSHHSIGGIVHPDSYQDQTATLVFKLVAKGSATDPCINIGDRVVLDQFKLSDKHEAAPGLWIVKESAVAILIPHASSHQT